MQLRKTIWQNCEKKTPKKTKSSKSHMTNFLRAYARWPSLHMWFSFSEFLEAIHILFLKEFSQFHRRGGFHRTNTCETSLLVIFRINSKTFHKPLWWYWHKFAKGNLDTHTTLIQKVGTLQNKMIMAMMSQYYHQIQKNSGSFHFSHY